MCGTVTTLVAEVRKRSDSFRAGQPLSAFHKLLCGLGLELRQPGSRIVPFALTQHDAGETGEGGQTWGACWPRIWVSRPPWRGNENGSVCSPGRLKVWRQETETRV